MNNKDFKLNEAGQPVLHKAGVSGSLPSVEEAGAAAVAISENIQPSLSAKEQALFIAGFQECVKWLGFSRQ